MPFELQIIRATEFVRVGAQGKLDFKASKETLTALAEACRKRGLDRALLDLRSLPVPAKPVFTPSELGALVETFREVGFGPRQRLAVLYKSDPHLGARTFAFISRMRGWRVRAFGDFESALLWLSAGEAEKRPQPEGQAVPIQFPEPRKTIARPMRQRPGKSRPSACQMNDKSTNTQAPSTREYPNPKAPKAGEGALVIGAWCLDIGAFFPVAASLLVLTATGCKLVEKTASLPVKAVTAVMPGGESQPPDPAALQIELQRFADEYASRTTAALDDYARVAGTPDARRQALKWTVAVSAAAVGIASGPNPYANLLDFLAVTSITRTALEEVWSKTAQGAAFQPWLEVSRSLETNAWKLADGVFTPEQQQELRDVIRLWWEANPGVRTGFFVRPQEFSSLIRQSGEKTQRSGSVFSLVGLDPTAGLDPAVREVTRTRLFAERAMFTLQRMPFLVRWQVELMTDELLRETQVTELLDSAERLSYAAAQLPDRFTAERKAILDALEAQDGKLRALAGEVGRTLTAGEKMSTSLHETLVTFDALMKRFGVGEPKTTPPDTNSPPFNILDYARAATEIAAMSQQLDTLIKDTAGTLDSPALDRRMADVNALLKRAQGDARSVLNHAFLLAAGLILLAFICATVYRRTHK